MSPSKINIIGYGHTTQENFNFKTDYGKEYKVDVRPYLKEKKGAKFLSKQDSLAMESAYKAWKMAKISNIADPDRVGIYLCTGILPFEDTHLNKLTLKSHIEGKFDITKFSTDSFNSLNPLLTFKCLPNMSLYHISHNLKITGDYFITYPGVPEWFNILKKAIFQLTRGIIDYAIVGAIADQRNFLVQNHIRRVLPKYINKEVDSASMIILTIEQGHQVYGTINNINCNYTPSDPVKHPEALLSPGNYFKCFTGVAEASLFMTMSLQNGQRGLLNYEYINSYNGSNYQLEMDLL